MTHILNISPDYIAVARPRFPPRDLESRIKFISTSPLRMNMKRGTGVPAMEFQGHAFHSRGGGGGERGEGGSRDSVNRVADCSFDGTHIGAW